MHSITEGDGVPSDPYEVLCHMAALIIEGRMPLHIPNGISDCTVSGEIIHKPQKPYHEGPHCPNFMKLFNKKSSSLHKCNENNFICIRFGKLKQHLLYMFEKSVPISIEVSLGPDCLCGELRSQSTLVAVAPCKRDVVLEQWTISITSKRSHEPSQMSVMNLYQAVRSLLHFSQLTAWYMSNNGMKPSNVIYRVGVPGDTAFVADDNFIKHDFPVADINKGVSMKISVKSPPRMENIPSVYCPQHSCGHLDGAQSIHQEVKDFTRLNKEKKGFGMSLKLNIDETDEQTDWPSKFQGVRKKIYKSQERKNKSRISYSGRPDLCDCLDYLDSIAVEKKGTRSKNFAGLYSSLLHEPQCLETRCFSNETFVADIGKSLELVKPKSFSTVKTYPSNMFKRKLNAEPRNIDNVSSERSQAKALEIVDDRMQITCGISGKHHCKCEYEEDVDNIRVEKPRRRRSLGKPKVNEGSEDGITNSEADKILHGKFKDVDCGKPCTITLKTIKRSMQNESSKWLSSDLPVKKKSLTENLESKIESLPASEVGSDLDSDSCASDSEGLKKEGKGPVNEIMENKRADLEKKVIDYESEKEWESSENPFTAATSGTTKTSKLAVCSPKDDLKSDGTLKVCDSSKNNNLCSRELDKNETKSNCDCTVDEKIGSVIFLKDKLEEEKEKEKGSVRKSNLVSEVSAKDANVVPMEMCHDVHQSTPILQCTHRMNLDFTSKNKHSAVKDLSDIGNESCQPENSGPSEFISKSWSRLKSFFDKRDWNGEKLGIDEEDENSTNNLHNIRIIPVPSAQDKLKFRRSLDSAAQLVFHRCSGLPLTSSPAPVRRNNNSFSFDSSLNSVSAIKSALFDSANSISSEDENESEGSLRSPASPGAWSVASKSINYHSLSPLPLLGTFEESVLNGRLEPVSTVQGFTAELGASGSFCPRHLYLPVTVFFYTLGDNDKVSAPYLGHINLGKKGYSVPRSGTIQVTLFNPLRTVVKMFVVVYDLHDMPPNSHTFLRQRTLYVPTSQKESIYFDKKDAPFEHEDYHKYLRYLIHLRFISGKTGRIYLHTDIRMIIFRKADEDTANALGRQVDGETFELRSHTHGPTNPKFSPRN